MEQKGQPRKWLGEFHSDVVSNTKPQHPRTCVYPNCTILLVKVQTRSDFPNVVGAFLSANYGVSGHQLRKQNVLDIIVHKSRCSAADNQTAEYGRPEKRKDITVEYGQHGPT